MSSAAMYLGLKPVIAAYNPVWTRPSEWMTLPAVSVQGMKGLIGIPNEDGNYVAIRCTTSSGTYTVDWGDGTSSAGVTSGTSAEKLYVYAAITNTATSSTTPTIDGMRQCIVTVTPDTANITLINLQVGHSRSTLQTGRRVPWLDINIAGAYIAGSGILIGGPDRMMSFLERVNIGTIGAITSFTSLFENCHSLQSVNAFDTSYCQTFTSMFRYCYELRAIPLFDMSAGRYFVASKTSSYITLARTLGGSAIVMGSNITSGMLVKIATDTVVGGSITSVVATSNVNVLTSIDSGLSVGDEVKFRTLAGGSGLVAAATVMTYFAVNCNSLQAVPLWNLTCVTNFASAFNACLSLKTVPLWDLSSNLTMAQSFQYCYSLEYCPAFNTKLCTTFANTFDGCGALETAPFFDTSCANTVTYMFNGCSRLRNIPTYNLSSCVNTSYMFRYCYNLRSVPLFNMLGVQTVRSMFEYCGSLTTIPAFDLTHTHRRRKRVPPIIAPHWTLASGWVFNAGKLEKNAAGTGAATISASATALALSDASDDIIDTATDHTFVAGDYVRFSSLIGGGGLVNSKVYRVLAANLNARTFQVEELNADGTFGGTAVDFVSNIISGNVNWWDNTTFNGAHYKVTIVVSAYSGGNYITPSFGGVNCTSINTTGTTVSYVTSTGTGRLILTPSNTAVRCVIDSVTVEEMPLLTDFLLYCVSLSDLNVVGIVRNFTVTACKFSRTGLQKVMTNLGNAEPASQTITMTSNHGTVDLTAGDKAIATAAPKSWATNPA